MQLSDFPLNALMEITSRPPLVFVRGEGAWIYDHEGREYLDFVQGWAVNCLGHSPRAVVDALAAQAATLVNPSPAFWNGPSARLAQRLVAHSCFDRVFFANTGAEANEGAIKLARKWGAKFRGGAYEIITFDHAFHGRTLATMAASGKAGWDKLFEPKVPGFPKAVLNDLASVERLVTDRTVAVMLEPIQGEAGVLPATDEFLLALRAFTQARGLLLVLDEVQTGIGRTGKLFGYEHAGIEPDIITLGKGIGGGVPLAALLAKQAVCCFEHGDQGGTYNGNPLMTAVGCAVLDSVLAPGFLDGVVERGRQVVTGLRQLAQKHGLGEVRGRGLLVALDLGREAGAKVVDAARERGLLINSPRPQSLRFMPALTTSGAEVETMLDRLDASLGDVLGR
jgi:acetylornithine/N-succinyldiaminopimelate aminotransferase